jgi:hypothetical protein
MRFNSEMKTLGRELGQTIRTIVSPPECEQIAQAFRPQTDPRGNLSKAELETRSSIWIRLPEELQIRLLEFTSRWEYLEPETRIFVKSLGAPDLSSATVIKTRPD